MKGFILWIYDLVWAPIYIRVYSSRYFRDRLAPHLKAVSYDFRYSRSGTGYRASLTLRRLSKKGFIRGKDLLLLGTETGRDVTPMWIPYQPSSVLGIDILPHMEQWNQISRDAPHVRFACMDAMQLALPASSFDLVYSSSMLEHVTDLDRMFSECRRVLRPEGAFHADFGPLWFSFGGPHVAALKYDHLLLDWDEYLSNAKQIGEGWEFWLDKGLFNRYTLKEYLEAFTRFFKTETLMIVGSPDGEKFRSENPKVWTQLTSTYKEADLLTRLLSLTGIAR